jgi:hypothetical protein
MVTSSRERTSHQLSFEMSSAPGESSRYWIDIEFVVKMAYQSP